MGEQFLLLLIVWYAVFVMTATVHEAAHAFMAWRLGDSTGYLGGSLSLNPLPHIRREPIGMILAPLASCFLNGGRWMFGWASCPYDPQWALRYPQRAGMMALAGPVSNAVLAFAAALALRYGLSSEYFQLPNQGFHPAQIVVGNGSAGSDGLAITLSVIFILNLALAVFNMFPFPPLDGSAVLLMFLPYNAARKLQEFLWDPTYQFLGIVAAWYLAPLAIGHVLSPAIRFIYSAA
jgi:Zn-dependent protease